MIVDPDPDEIYTKRKKRLSKLPTECSPETSTPKYQVMARESHCKGCLCLCGQKWTSTSKVLEKEWGMQIIILSPQTWGGEDILKDIEANSDQRYFYPRAKCYHSFRKKDAPQSIRFALCIVLGQVMHANCSCKAGNVDYCNHVLALMFKACKFSLYDSKKTYDLNQENDEHPDLACTSQLQRRHAKGRGDIHPQPVIEITVSKTKLDETKTKEGIKSLLMKLGWILAITSSQKWN